MKVSKVKKTGTTQTRKVNKPEPVMSFTEVMAVTEEDKEREHFEERLEDIKKKGKELAQKKDIEILLSYKEMVKDFVDEAVKFGLKVTERRGHGRAGRSKVMRMVSMIDEKLIKITEDMLKMEQSSLKLLTKIGEIEGLLLNLYA